MTAQHELFAKSCAAAEDQGKDSVEPSPPFQLTRHFAPPRAAVISVTKIHPHPAMISYELLPTVVQLEPLRDCTETLFDEPLFVTEEGIVIDGNKRWKIAQELGVLELPCVVFSLSQNEALIRILDKAQVHSWLNPFCRIELALTLQGPLREKAKEHQRAVGRQKHLAKLPKADQINVHKTTAERAGASEGSVRKVKDILANAIPQLLQEARQGTRSIHAAWKVSKLQPDEQARELGRRASNLRQSRRVRASGRTNQGSSEHDRRLLAQAREIFEQLCKSELLTKFQEPSSQLLADMERELDVLVSEKTVESTQAA